jgi:hypothetical protein
MLQLVICNYVFRRAVLIKATFRRNAAKSAKQRSTIKKFA